MGSRFAVLVGLLLVQSVQAGDFTAKVVNVHDGDTLTVLLNRKQIRVRLVDIDAPELKQAFGRRSRESLANLCAGVQATIHETGKDRYGRTLGGVTCNGVDANAEQVRRGMAWVFVRFAPKDSPLYSLEVQAQLERRGLWIELAPTPPWDWRRSKTLQQAK